jgi:hypothetical protein
MRDFTMRDFTMKDFTMKDFTMKLPTTAGRNEECGERRGRRVDIFMAPN